MQAALSDSFDTPRAMRVLSELIRESNVHIQTNKSEMDIRGLESIARWVTKMVGIFGLDANASPPYDGLGWASNASNNKLSAKEIVEPYSAVYEKVTGEVKQLDVHSEVLDKLMAVNVKLEVNTISSSGAKDPEVLAMPYLRTVSKIRDELRKLAPSSSAKKQILSLSDRIRDVDLTLLGVYLDDRTDDQGALIKFIPKEELLAQKEEKAAKEREKAAAKEAQRLAREKDDLAKAEKAKVSPVDMFREDERFGAWDEEGMPTKTKEGDDVPKSALKKLRKEWERQKKAHEEWKEKSGA
jgi:cysteinyl-tRNA synthetase